MKAREKTQTAVHSPLSPAEFPDTAILLLVGSADTPGLPATRRLVFVRDELEIGRSPSDAAEARGTSLVVSDPLVSSEHARITRVSPGGFEILDLGSKNGTLIDNARIDGRVRLRNGSLVFFGNQIGVFRMVSAVELEAIKNELVSPLGPVATTSATLATACDRLRRLSGADGELLILGETGVGKEVYARAVHAHGGRSGRFTAINCAAIPRELVESELFGYRQGAHSTAHQAKAGLIEEAEGGTLFLDEIGEMTQEAQIKLLRFLQDRELTPLGSTRPRRIDVRIIAATNRTTSSGKTPMGLRDDIIARLGAAPIHLPPLRHRIEDIGALAAYFLRGNPGTTFDQPAFRALSLYEWPLNVRELEKIVTTAAVLTGGQRPISVRDLPEPIARAATAQSGGTRRTASPSPTPAQIEDLLRRHNGNVAEVSRELGKHRAAVWRWMKKWGIGVDKFKKTE
ncbi:MAG: sigma 54-interacting transcriptional regulator [Deltaproteobacteria bacterium]|nr:sigma 54-interacting transcriptional regulator [Deltaproteobacteria bacterium]